MYSISDIKNKSIKVVFCLYSIEVTVEGIHFQGSTNKRFYLNMYKTMWLLRQQVFSCFL